MRTSTGQTQQTNQRYQKDNDRSRTNIKNMSQISDKQSLNQTFTENSSRLKNSGRHDFAIEAKNILDQHINYLSKEVYYKLREDIMIEGNDEVIKIFKDYKFLQNSDILISNCMRYYNMSEYSKYNRLNNSTNNASIRDLNKSLNGINNAVNQDERPTAQQQNYMMRENGGGFDQQKRKVQSSDNRTSKNNKNYNNNNSKQVQVQQLVTTQSDQSFINKEERIQEIKQKMSLQNQDFKAICDKTLPFATYNPLKEYQFVDLFINTFPELKQQIQNRNQFNSDYQLEIYLHELFNLFDVDQDHHINKDELQNGLQLLFKENNSNRKSFGNNHNSTQKSKQHSQSKKEQEQQSSSQIDADQLFKLIDKEKNQKLFLRDFEAFTKPYLESMRYYNSRKQKKEESAQKDWKGLTIEQIAHNLSIELSKRCDYQRRGYIDQKNFAQWVNNDSQSFKIMVDLISCSVSFFDDYEDILRRNRNGSSNSPIKFQQQNQKFTPSKSNLEQIEQEQLRQQRIVSNNQSKNQYNNKTQEVIPLSTSTLQFQQQQQKVSNNFTESETRKIQKKSSKQERLADCSGFGSKILQSKQEALKTETDTKLVQNKSQILNNSPQKTKAQYFSTVLDSDSFKNAEKSINQLAVESGLKQINALEVSKQMKIMIDSFIKEEENGNSHGGITFEEFKSILEPQLKKKAQSKLQKQTFDNTLKQIFDLFDTDRSGKVNSQEMANCLALLCGGTFQDKVQGAFILFDENNSNTLSFDELGNFIKTVFKVLFDIAKNNKNQNEDQRSFEDIVGVSYDKLCLATVNKCYSDLKISVSEDINFHLFLEWMTQQCLFDPVQIDLVSKQYKPPQKEEVKQKAAQSTKEYLKKFFEDQIYLKNLQDFISHEANLQLLQSMPISEFGELFIQKRIINKQEFYQGMRLIIQKNSGNSKSLQKKEISQENEKQKIDQFLQRLYMIFDTDKNGLLDSLEVASIMTLLCKGSLPQKLKQIFNTFVQKGNNKQNVDQNENPTLTFQELKQFFHCIFKFSLDSGKEILLDYDLSKLSELTAKSCFDYNLQDDLENGSISKEDIIRWTKKVGGTIW